MKQACESLIMGASWRRCCPFFTFELVFEPNLGSIWLHLRGGQASRSLLQAHLVARGGTMEPFVVLSCVNR